MNKTAVAFTILFVLVGASMLILAGVDWANYKIALGFVDFSVGIVDLLLATF